MVAAIAYDHAAFADLELCRSGLAEVEAIVEGEAAEFVGGVEVAVEYVAGVVVAGYA